MALVLLTGASGFLGSWVARRLVAHGHAVRALLRGSSGIEALTGLPLERVTGDVTDRPSVERAMMGVDAVIHAAGFISMRPRDRDRLHQVNVEGARNLLEAAGRRGIRAIHTSSIATLGYSPDPVPRDERYLAGSAEFSDYPYAESKLRAETLALALARQGSEVVVLNPGLLLGPGGGQGGSTRLVQQYLQGLTRVSLPGGISFCDVRDVAEAHVLALSRGRSGERYLLGGHNQRYADLLRMLEAMTGMQRVWSLPVPLARYWGWVSQVTAAVQPHPFEELNLASVKYASRFNYCTVDKAVRELGYPLRPLTETLRDTIADLRGAGAGRGPAPASASPVARQ